MQSRNQYLQQVRKEYLGAGKKHKQALLDEAEQRTGLERKYLIRKLAAAKSLAPKSRRARVPTYNGQVAAALVEVWDIFDQPCGQRLAPLLPEHVPRLRQFGELVVDNQTARLLQQIAPATIDRLLAREKEVRLLNRHTQAKKHPLLYQQIPPNIR